MEKIKLSVIIPAYNAENTLPKTLDCIFSQDLDRTEVICVNDGSSDDTLLILESYKQTHPNLRVISIANSGPGVARNVGMEAAEGDHIVFCDADDLMPYGALKTMLCRMNEAKVDVFCFLYERRYENGEIVSINAECPEESSDAYRFSLRSGVRAKIFRRSFIKDNQICFPAARHGEDNLFLARILSFHPSLSFSTEIVYYYVIDRRGNGALTQDRSKEAFLQRLTCWEEKYRIWTRVVPEAKKLMTYWSKYLFTQWMILESEDARRDTFCAFQEFMKAYPINKKVFYRIALVSFADFSACNSYDDYILRVACTCSRKSSFFRSELVFSKVRPEKPEVSVIIPVHNTEKYLLKCLLSLVAQSFRDFEVICVDDRSTDASPFFLDMICSLDHRFIKIAGEGRGAGAARNLALGYARGDYLLFLDSDDFFAPNLLSVAYDAMERDQLDVFLWNNLAYDNVEKTTMPDRGNFWPDLLPQNKIFSGTDTKYIFNLTSGSPWNKMFRTSFFKEQDLRFMEQARFNDIFVVRLLMAHAKRISASTLPLVYYRVNNTKSLQGTMCQSADDSFRALEALHERLIQDGLWANENIRLSFLNCNMTTLFYVLRSCSKTDAHETVFNYIKNNNLMKQLDRTSAYKQLLFDEYQVVVSKTFEEYCAFVKAKNEIQVGKKTRIKLFLKKHLPEAVYRTLYGVWSSIRYDVKYDR